MKVLRTSRAILAHALPLALVLAVLVSAAAAQTRKKDQGPRAMGLLQWTSAGAQPVLVPITIWINGQYQDASIYMASPVPMALQPGIVYEAYEAGVSQGLFEIREPRRRRASWIATGSFTTPEMQAAADKARAARDVAPGATVGGSAEDEGPPRLRRPKPGSETQSTAEPAPSAPAQPAPVASPPAPSPVSIPEDSDRPVLKRGKPAEKPAPEPEPETTAPASASTSTAAKPTPKPAAAPIRELVAISDASNPTSPEWKFPYTPEEEKGWAEKIAAFAAREVAASEKSSAVPALTDYQVHAFDLDKDNEPLFVITGRIAARPAVAASRRAAAVPARPETYVAVVARLDIDNNIRRIFSSVTTAGRLDIVGRMQFLDAVDGDGDGHAELLFRRLGQDSSRYQLFRAGADRLWLLFDSAHE